MFEGSYGAGGRGGRAGGGGGSGPPARGSPDAGAGNVGAEQPSAPP